jgi:integrase
MASVTTRPNGHRWVTFKAPNGKRQTIRLGAASQNQADNFKEKIEKLLVCVRLGEPPSANLIEWLSDLPDNIHDTLSKCGVVNARGARTVGDLTAWFAKRYAKHCEQNRRKPSTLINVTRATDAMNRFFGKDRRLRNFKSYLDTPDEEETEGEKFRAWLAYAGRVKGGSLAPTTVSSMCRRAREIFDKAVARGWMKANPLAEERNWVNTNPERDEYVTREQFDRVMDEADPDSRLFFSLVRYAGLRGLSELSLLEWTWVNWTEHTLFVKAPKTSRYEGQGSRFVPLSDKLYKLLLSAMENAPEGATHVFGETPITNVAWDNRLEAACRRAKVVMWPKPKINLRASCEYDWLRVHPMDEVAAWMGHSPETMLKHYSRVAKQRSAEVAGGRASAPNASSLRAS